jgi:hypothetical protein
MSVNFSSDSLKITENDHIDIFCIIWLILAALGVSGRCFLTLKLKKKKILFYLNIYSEWVSCDIIFS